MDKVIKVSNDIYVTKSADRNSVRINSTVLGECIVVLPEELKPLIKALQEIQKEKTK